MSSDALGAELTGNLLVQSQTPGSVSYQISEFDFAGSITQTFVPPQPQNSSDLIHPRDLVVDTKGSIRLFNGTFDPYLSTYDPVIELWTHRTHDGWSTINNVAYGGIAQIENLAFVSNMSAFGNSSHGVVVFDLSNGTSFEIATSYHPTDLTVGLDGSLWMLSQGNNVIEIDPDTFATGSMRTLTGVGGTIRSIAVDEAGQFFAATLEGTVAKLSSSGVLLDSMSLGLSLIDIDVSISGQLAIGSASNGAWLTTTALEPAVLLEPNRSAAFVTFIPPILVPEPSCVLSISLIGFVFCTVRREGSNRRDDSDAP